MKRFNKILSSLVVSLALLLTPVATISAATNPLADACKGKAASSSICKQAGGITGASENPVAKTIHGAANILALVAAVAAVIMIVIAGLTMVTSSGNSESVASARRRIIYAVVGLVVIALSWAITTFLINRLIK